MEINSKQCLPTTTLTCRNASKKRLKSRIMRNPLLLTGLPSLFSFASAIFVFFKTVNDVFLSLFYLNCLNTKE